MTESFHKNVLKGPLVANLELSGKCNLQCDHCFVGEKPLKELPTSEWKRVISECADLGIMVVGVAGGEPLIRRDILDIVEYTVSEGIESIVIATNGTVIPDGMMEFLKKTDAHVRLMISLDSHREEFHDALRGVKGTYKKVIKSIDEIINAGQMCALSTVITKENYQDIKGIWEIMKNKGINRWFLERIQPLGSARKSSRKWEPSLEEWKETLKFLFEEVYGHDTTLAFGDALRGIFWTVRHEPWFPEGLVRESIYPGCEAGKTSIAVTATGDVIPCVQWRKSLDSVKSHTLEEIWNENPFYQELRTLRVDDIDICKNCEEKTFCRGGCRGVAYEFSGSIYAPNPSCPKLSRERTQLYAEGY